MTGQFYNVKAFRSTKGSFINLLNLALKHVCDSQVELASGNGTFGFLNSFR